jgi:tetratricopeptide (TPR) repeat protein
MGDLAQTLLSETIRSLVHARRGGILVVSNHEVTKGIFFRGGQIVFASSTLDRDKLGESLIRLGRISRSEFAAAYQATREKKRRLGEELVGAGLLTEEELGRILAHQVQKIVLSLFTWAEGDTVFQESAEAIPADLALDLSTHRLLLEGSRIFPDVERLERGLGRQQRRLRVASRPPFDLSRVTLTPVERQVLADAADELRIGDMLARNAARALLVRAVYSLWAGGILEECAEEETEEGSFEGDTGTFHVAVAVAEPGPAADRREDILRLYEALPRATHYEILNVSPDATQEAILGAHRLLLEEQERDWRDLKGDVRFASVLSTLGLRRHEAVRILSDRDQRREYDRSLGELKPARSQRITAEDHSRALKMVKDALALLENGERDAAVPLLLSAVDTDPEDFRCRRLLALTLAQHRSLYRAAERHFLTALEMQPEDVELRYRFALYYKKVGLPKRALVHLRAVLIANPQHDAARLELKALEQQQA